MTESRQGWLARYQRLQGMAGEGLRLVTSMADTPDRLSRLKESTGS